MKKTLFLLLTLLAVLSASTAQAVDLATAKVLKITGNVLKYSGNGNPTELLEGEIIKEGDGITTSFLSSVDLVFSNGSELTIEENSSVSFEKLAQESFGGSKRYEQLSADPSRSQTLLQLNYGQVDGHVKRLRSDSDFEIQTPLGTAAIRGTRYKVSFIFDTLRGQIVLTVDNYDGIVEFSSPYTGEVVYGKRSTSDILVDDTSEQATKSITSAVPPKHKIIVRILTSNPLFDDIISKKKNLSPVDQVSPPIVPPVPPQPPIITPEDGSIVPASPDGSAS